MIGFNGMMAALVIGIAISLAGPAAADNVLRWASPGGAATFDPHAFDEDRTFAQLAQVYEPLIGVDSDLMLAPRLATTWRLVDPTTWEFELRHNVGTPLTAQDVALSFERAKTELSPPVGVAHRIESIAAVRSLDEHTVRIETKFPDPGLQDKLRGIYVISERWAETNDARFPVNVSAGEENFASRHANGTGPFILKQFEPNGRAVMVRNPDWWGFERYPHNLDRIEFTPIADSKQRIAALLRGDLDLLTDVPLSAVDQIKSTPGLKLAQASQPRTAYLAMDQASPKLRSSQMRGRNPFHDQRVRQAIYQAIDIETIRDDVMHGLAVPAGMLVAPGVNVAPTLDQRLPYDPATAKRLLTEAGYPEGFDVTLDCPNNSSAINGEAICRTIAAELNDIGIDVTVNAQPKDLIYAKIDSRQSDFYLDSYATLDSYEVFDELYRTNGGLNASGYSNPGLDQLIAKIDREMVTYGRDALIEEAWKIVLADIVYIPLHHQMIVWAMRDDLDLPVYPFNFPLFREARFK
jgi:peptide/nickel transport system substrate-binding protein